MVSRPPWLSAALEHHRAGRFVDAERLYEDALRANPADPDALHLLGLIFGSRQNIEKAGQLVARAIAIKPDRADFYASLGNIFLSKGLGAEMAECYRRALLFAFFTEIPASFETIAASAGRVTEPPIFKTDVAHYRSQFLQDVFLDRWIFEGMENGVFVDVGAHDGVTYSNSYFFEKIRRWHGLCIEPNPSVFESLSVNRQCKILNCCVSDRVGEVPFLKVSGFSEMLSGIVDRYAPEHRLRIDDEIRQYGGSSEVMPIVSRPFSEIVAESGFDEITYLSVDTEGSELSILQSADFNRVFVHALTVESNFDHVKVRMIALLRDLGFDYGQTLGHDLLFLNRKSPFHARYSRLRSG